MLLTTAAILIMVGCCFFGEVEKNDSSGLMMAFYSKFSRHLIHLGQTRVMAGHGQCSDSGLSPPTPVTLDIWTFVTNGEESFGKNQAFELALVRIKYS